MRNEDVSILKQEARSMKLVYTADTQAGYARARRGKVFVYFDTHGKKIRDKDELKRIKNLALPPAWERVWICSKENGHLQATGFDVSGRKQYKYHKKWSEVRNERKHNRMREFAKALPAIRKQVETDMQQTEFSKEKVVALAISIMDKTFIRVGNSEYTRLYGSYGLTSLRNKHIKIAGSKVLFAFKGKKGVQQEITLTHSRLAHIIKKLKDIPGQELFQFYEEDGSKKTIDSGAINEYIEKCTGQNFSAKDFRTWWGTVTAAASLAESGAANSEAEVKEKIVNTLEVVAEKLGNTATVCKKYYVHPKLLSTYSEGGFEKYLTRFNNIEQQDTASRLNAQEKITLEFIENECVAA